MFLKDSPMAAFELQTFTVGSDRSATWATTTAQLFNMLDPYNNTKDDFI